jgi:hypothetical protein
VAFKEVNWQNPHKYKAHRWTNDLRTNDEEEQEELCRAG